jgi:putative selenate reductase
MQPALTPWPLQVLLGRVAREWETRHRIFDLPSGKFHHVDPTADLGTSVMGHAVATSIGPAAGPHTQLAQNIVTGWLAGARIFELKTVQVRDDLDIPRPCIDVAGVGYNVEWSQELRIEQSLDEYVKA